MILGIDTSNYTTSAAVYDADSNTAVNYKKPLPVKSGERGLRQSDAVFHHTVNLPEVIIPALADMDIINAVGVSVRPRDVDGSYMPCFRSGLTAATVIAAAVNTPVFEFSHQAGHIAAALYSSGKLDLIGEKFVAFHFSGGTTEAVLVTPDENTVFKCEIISSSLDLKAGQAIDRCGVMLGLDFPAGPALERLALESDKIYKIKSVLKNGNPSLSGVENKFLKMFADKESACDIARFVIEYVASVALAMTEYITDKYGELPIIYAGGVMSNGIIKSRLNGDNRYFAEPQFSADNASGVAILAALKHGGILSDKR